VVQGALHRSVYFPKGVQWVHYSTGTVHNGGDTEVVAVPWDELAMYKKKQ
jgi:alpha-glucosidase (family GH31 glycosyl hydrolase)